MNEAVSSILWEFWPTNPVRNIFGKAAGINIHRARPGNAEITETQGKGGENSKLSVIPQPKKCLKIKIQREI